MIEEKVTYICDRRKCEVCAFPKCAHTQDISHAENFKKHGCIYEETRRPTDIKRLLEFAEKRLDDEIANGSIADWRYWRGYIDALHAVERAMADD